MDFKKLVRPKIKGKYCTIDFLAKVLKSTPEDLLDAACEGRLHVFVQRPDATRICSVHADALDLEDQQLYLDKVLRRLPPPDRDESEPIETPPRKLDESQSLDPDESQPLNMSAFDIEGLRLSRFDCQQIREKQRFTQHLFSSGLKARYGWVDPVEPIRGHVRYFDKRTLRPEGWSLACYGLTQPISFLEGIGYSRPQGVELSLDKLMVTTDDVDQYVDTLNPEYLVSEFIVDGRIAIDKLPSYVSRKLIYLIEANQMYWGDCVPTDVNKVRAIQEATRTHLKSADFQVLFEVTKGPISVGPLLFCRECVTPPAARLSIERDELRKAEKSTMARESKKTQEDEDDWRTDWTGHLTPEILLMLYASTRTWGRPSVRLDDVSSHPLAQDVAELFQELGFTREEAGYASTILRREGAGKGRPVPREDPLTAFRDGLKALKPRRT